MFGNIAHEIYRATQEHTDTLSSVVTNISNVRTLAYKKEQQNFAEALDGAVTKYKSKDFAQGALQKTEEPLDFAISGKGFFEVELPNGTRAYTRVGRLRLSSEGELLTMEGYRIIPQVEQAGKPAPIVFDPEKADEFTELGLNLKITSPKLIIPSKFIPVVDEDGTINGVEDPSLEHSSGDKVKLGKLSVVVFNNTNGLEDIGKGYFAQTKESGQPRDAKLGMNGETQIRQGHLEGSNVDIPSTFMELSQIKNILSAQFKSLKVIDKIYESVHYTISRNA